MLEQYRMGGEERFEAMQRGLIVIILVHLVLVVAVKFVVSS